MPNPLLIPSQKQAKARATLNEQVDEFKKIVRAIVKSLLRESDDALL